MRIVETALNSHYKFFGISQIQKGIEMSEKGVFFESKRGSDNTNFVRFITIIVSLYLNIGTLKSLNILY